MISCFSLDIKNKGFSALCITPLQSYSELSDSLFFGLLLSAKPVPCSVTLMNPFGCLSEMVLQSTHTEKLLISLISSSRLQPFTTNGYKIEMLLFTSWCMPWMWALAVQKGGSHVLAGFWLVYARPLTSFWQPVWMEQGSLRMSVGCRMKFQSWTLCSTMTYCWTVVTFDYDRMNWGTCDEED